MQHSVFSMRGARKCLHLGCGWDLLGLCISVSPTAVTHGLLKCGTAVGVSVECVPNVRPGFHPQHHKKSSVLKRAAPRVREPVVRAGGEAD